MDIALDTDVDVSAHWTPRRFLQHEDARSRENSLSHSQLPPISRAVIAASGFTIRRDLFATSCNALTETWFSEHWELGCSGIDAFSLLWIDGDYAFPPFSLGLAVLRRVYVLFSSGSPVPRMAIIVPRVIFDLPHHLPPSIFTIVPLHSRLLLIPPNFAASRSLHKLVCVLTHPPAPPQ